MSASGEDLSESKSVSCGLKTSDFEFELPPERIAQEPLADRGAARMMVVNRASKDLMHTRVRELPLYLQAGDVMVLNDTRVIPARLFGHKEGSGGKVELLLLEETGDNVWEALCGSSRRPRPGTRLILAEGRMLGTVMGWGPTGKMTIALQSDAPILEVLESAGIPPLPPYIKRKGLRTPAAVQHDRDFYQTVYARVPGAVAAPTAGLHFDDALLADLRNRGVERVHVTLHVGMGTFKPVSAESIADHVMEPERYEVPAETAIKINDARRRGRRILAVGSTVVRTLETVADDRGVVTPGLGRTRIFIHPPMNVRSVDMMLTNFHLPRSTLLMMISAMAGDLLVKRAYAEAIREQYRFYSYGDCMLIV